MPHISDSDSDSDSVDINVNVSQFEMIIKVSDYANVLSLPPTVGNYISIPTTIGNPTCIYIHPTYIQMHGYLHSCLGSDQ